MPKNQALRSVWTFRLRLLLTSGTLYFSIQLTFVRLMFMNDITINVRLARRSVDDTYG